MHRNFSDERYLANIHHCERRDRTGMSRYAVTAQDPDATGFLLGFFTRLRTVNRAVRGILSSPRERAEPPELKLAPKPGPQDQTTRTHRTPATFDGRPALPARVKPRWRGVSHQYAFFASILPALCLVWSAPTVRAAVAASIYAASLVALLGTSAIYHRITWTPRARYWMARLDLAMIFVLIAGSCTPVALLALEEPLGSLVLWLAWGAAAAGIVLKLLWTAPPKWASALVYVLMGSLGVLFMPALARSVGMGAIVLYLVGGVLYIAGAVIYGIQRPDPSPSVFGYHEVFHAFVVVAAAAHFAAVAVCILPLAA